eukprot:scaffold16263_cov39-Cyclotella_meneghiniana.AAC.2
MSDRGIVCVCSTPALRAPPLAASEARNSAESLDEGGRRGSAIIVDLVFLSGLTMDYNFGFGGR